MNKFLLSVVILIGITKLSKSQTVSDFENLTLLPNNYWNGTAATPQVTTFTSGNASFVNAYDTSFGGYWGGFAYSNIMDTINGNFMNQYACIAGVGYNASAKYAVAYQDFNSANNKIILNGNAVGKMVQGFYINNSTWAYKEMKNGGPITKKFGGITGNDPDYFKLNIGGWYNGNWIQDTASFYLADFRDSNNTNDYIIKDWQWFDLNKLGNVDSLSFWLESTDTSFGYINTPTYFCMDNFTTADVPLGFAQSTISNKQLVVYPNPVSNTLYIKTDSEFGVYNSFMQKMNCKVVTLNEKLKYIDCSIFASGMYFINSSDNNLIKFIKQ